MHEIEPEKVITNKRKNLSTSVANVTCNNDLSLNSIALPKNSPTRTGVNEPATIP
jgi:hypothetical protein